MCHAPSCARALVSLRGARARADQAAPGVAGGAPHAVPVARHLLSTRALRPRGAPAEARARPGRAPAAPSAAPLAKRRRGELFAHHPKHLIRVNTIGFTSSRARARARARAPPRPACRPTSSQPRRRARAPSRMCGSAAGVRRTTRSFFLPPLPPPALPLPSPAAPTRPPPHTHARHLWEESRSSPGALCGRERAGADAAACRPHVRAGRGLRRAVKGTFGGGNGRAPRVRTRSHTHTLALRECAEGGGGGAVWPAGSFARALRT